MIEEHHLYLPKYIALSELQPACIAAFAVVSRKHPARQTLNSTDLLNETVSALIPENRAFNEIN